MAAAKTLPRVDRNRKTITRQKTVLIVDDDTGILLLISNILKKNGYTVTAAASGKEAMDAFSKSLVDLAILDIQMPSMSGLELYGKMQEDETLQSIPVVFVTSDKDKETVMQAIEMGASGYIVKPRIGPSLLLKVRGALDKAKVDQGKLYLAKKIQAILAVLRQNKLPPAQASLENRVQYEMEERQNWARADDLFNEIPKEVFVPVYELMLSRLKIRLSTRDLDQAMKAGDLILEELQRPAR